MTAGVDGRLGGIHQTWRSCVGREDKEVTTGRRYVRHSVAAQRGDGGNLRAGRHQHSVFALQQHMRVRLCDDVSDGAGARAETYVTAAKSKNKDGGLLTRENLLFVKLSEIGDTGKNITCIRRSHIDSRLALIKNISSAVSVEKRACERV